MPLEVAVIPGKQAQRIISSFMGRLMPSSKSKEALPKVMVGITGVIERKVKIIKSQKEVQRQVEVGAEVLKMQFRIVKTVKVRLKTKMFKEKVLSL